MLAAWLRWVNAFVKADQTAHFRWVSVTLWDLHLDDYGSNNISDKDDGDDAIRGILGKSLSFILHVVWHP